MASPIRAVLFDLDGTLVDSYSLIAEAFQHACRTVLGREITETELLADWGAPAPVRFSNIDPVRVQELVDAYTAYYEVHHRRVRLFPGVRETLEDLAARGCRMAIVTSKGRGRTQQTLRALGLARFFGAVVDAQDIHAPKPSPDAILVALGRLESRREEALMVGDSRLDIEAARAAGVRSAAAMWGTQEADAVRAARPDHELESPAEVAALVASIWRSASLAAAERGREEREETMKIQRSLGLPVLAPGCRQSSKIPSWGARHIRASWPSNQATSPPWKGTSSRPSRRSTRPSPAIPGSGGIASPWRQPISMRRGTAKPSGRFKRHWPPT